MLWDSARFVSRLCRVRNTDFIWQKFRHRSPSCANCETYCTTFYRLVQRAKVLCGNHTTKSISKLKETGAIHSCPGMKCRTVSCYLCFALLCFGQRLKSEAGTYSILFRENWSGKSPSLRVIEIIHSNDQSDLTFCFRMPMEWCTRKLTWAMKVWRASPKQSPRRLNEAPWKSPRYICERCKVSHGTTIGNFRHIRDSKKT